MTWTCSKCYYPCLGVNELLNHIDNNHNKVKIKNLNETNK